MEQLHPDDFDRVGKALVDQLGVTPDEALRRLAAVRLSVVVDEDVHASPTLQASLLTLVNLGRRVFKRDVSVIDRKGVLQSPPLIPTPEKSLADAVVSLGGVVNAQLSGSIPIVLGRAQGDTGLRLSFDGWACRVGPAEWSEPLEQRERCVLAGVAGAALALSEVFFGSLGLCIEAGEREVGLSLWNPDGQIDSAEGPGPEVQYLPGEAWLLGVGHLGQGFVWALSMLPYADASKMELLLQDFDRVVKGNIGTQALSLERHIGRRKTLVCAEFLRGRGFDPGIVDRPFDERSRRSDHEPALALCGFDGSGPREILDAVRFERVIVCGTGANASDFDDLQVHTLPLSELRAKDLWPRHSETGRAERLAEANPFYQAYRKTHRCGEVDLAGVGVAAPFVGALAGAFAWAEVLRELHGGPRCGFAELPLRSLDGRRVRFSPTDAVRPRYAFPHLDAAVRVERKLSVEFPQRSDRAMHTGATV